MRSPSTKPLAGLFRRSLEKERQVERSQGRYFIIWLPPWAGKMNQIARCDLATRAGKMELSCPLGTTHSVPREKFRRKPNYKSFIDQAFAVKMAGYWPRSFFMSLWTSSPSRSMKTQKNNLVNIQPSWPHACSITNIFNLKRSGIKGAKSQFTHLETLSQRF